MGGFALLRAGCVRARAPAEAQRPAHPVPARGGAITKTCGTLFLLRYGFALLFARTHSQLPGGFGFAD
jgi:hypothetical protein